MRSYQWLLCSLGFGAVVTWENVALAKYCVALHAPALTAAVATDAANSMALCLGETITSATPGNVLVPGVMARSAQFPGLGGAPNRLFDPGAQATCGGPALVIYRSDSDGFRKWVHCLPPASGPVPISVKSTPILAQKDEDGCVLKATGVKVEFCRDADANNVCDPGETILASYDLFSGMDGEDGMDGQAAPESADDEDIAGSFYPPLLGNTMSAASLLGSEPFSLPLPGNPSTVSIHQQTLIGSQSRGPFGLSFSIKPMRAGRYLANSVPFEPAMSLRVKHKAPTPRQPNPSGKCKKKQEKATSRVRRLGMVAQASGAPISLGTVRSTAAEDGWAAAAFDTLELSFGALMREQGVNASRSGGVYSLGVMADLLDYSTQDGASFWNPGSSASDFSRCVNKKLSSAANTRIVLDALNECQQGGTSRFLIGVGGAIELDQDTISRGKMWLAATGSPWGPVLRTSWSPGLSDKGLMAAARVDVSLAQGRFQVGGEYSYDGESLIAAGLAIPIPGGLALYPGVRFTPDRSDKVSWFANIGWDRVAAR